MAVLSLARLLAAACRADLRVMLPAYWLVDPGGPDPGQVPSPTALRLAKQRPTSTRSHLSPRRDRHPRRVPAETHFPLL